MTRLSEDLPLDEVEQLIAEGEARRAEMLLVLQTQSQTDPDSNEAQQSLQAIEEALATLYCRRSYLQAMQEKP